MDLAIKDPRWKNEQFLLSSKIVYIKNVSAVVKSGLKHQQMFVCLICLIVNPVVRLKVHENLRLS